MLVEAAVAGREIECGVLAGVDGGPPEASLPAEIRVAPGAQFYDFEAKYMPDSGTEFDVPPDLPDEVIERVRTAAIDAFEALDCEGLARVDFFLADDGAAARERGQHDAGLHAGVDVPADVGGDRRRLPDAGRPADRRRDPPRHRLR